MEAVTRVCNFGDKKKEVVWFEFYNFIEYEKRERKRGEMLFGFIDFIEWFLLCF